VSCREFSEPQLWAFLDRELIDGERRRLESHLERCGHCLARLDQMRRRPLAFGEQRFAEPPADFHRRVMARIAVEAQPAWRTAERSWLALLLSARRVAAVSTTALALALSSALLVGAVLAMPAVEAATPPGQGPLANNMALAMRQALRPLGLFFQDWGWFVLLVGMAATVMVLSARALVVESRDRA
jgi:anti-sigma factor RsiW